MGNDSSVMKKMIQDYDLDTDSIIGNELIENIFNKAIQNSPTGTLSQKQTSVLLKEILENIGVIFSSSDISEMARKSMNEEGGFKIAEFRAALYRTVPKSKLTESVQLHTNEDSQAISFIASSNKETFILCDGGYIIRIGKTYEKIERIRGLERIVSVSCGFDHTAMLDYHGKVWTMGNNEFGKLGRGLRVMYSTKAAQIEYPGSGGKLPSFVHVSCGFFHTLCIGNDGSVWGFGSNKKRQLACITVNTGYPTQLAIQNAVQAACGEDHSLVLCADGSVWGCGYNDQSQLGLGSQLIVQSLTKLSIRTSIQSIACGKYFSAFLSVGGHAYVCGKLLLHGGGVEVFTSITCFEKKIIVKDISCRADSLYCITEERKLAVFGPKHWTTAILPHSDRIRHLSNSGFTSRFVFQDMSNKLYGFGEKENQHQPIRSMDIHSQEPELIPIDNNATQHEIENMMCIQAHIDVSCSLDPEGRISNRLEGVVCHDSQISIAMLNNIVEEFSFELSSTDTAVPFIFILLSFLRCTLEIEDIHVKLCKEEEPVSKVALLFFLKQNLPTWRQSTDLLMTTQEKYFAPGIDHNVFTKIRNLTLFCNGGIVFMFIPNEPSHQKPDVWPPSDQNPRFFVQEPSPHPSKILSEKEIISLVSTEHNVYFLSRDGEVFSLLNDMILVETEEVVRMNVFSIQGIFCTNYSPLFLGQNGILDACSLNNLSHSWGHPVSGVFCGQHNSFLLGNDGEVWASGPNACGQNGTGSLGTEEGFKLVVSHSNVISIACGVRHTIFLLSDGSVLACGSNGAGQLGLPDIRGSCVPLPVPHLQNIRQIFCQFNTSFCVTEEGTLLAFGHISSSETSWKPITIEGLEHVSMISTGIIPLEYFIAKDYTDNLWLLSQRGQPYIRAYPLPGFPELLRGKAKAKSARK